MKRVVAKAWFRQPNMIAHERGRQSDDPPFPFPGSTTSAQRALVQQRPAHQHEKHRQRDEFKRVLESSERRDFRKHIPDSAYPTHRQKDREQRKHQPKVVRQNSSSPTMRQK